MSEPILHSSGARPLTQSGELLNNISEFASRIEEIDPGSFAFRYPLTTKGTATLPSHFITNIFVFSAEMERVLDDLEQYCRRIEKERIQTSDQMKLALHALSNAT